MLIDRELVTKALQGLPTKFELEELIERLVFIEKVEKGLNQVAQGSTVSHKQVKELVKEW
jgi:hypothetical protein